MEIMKNLKNKVTLSTPICNDKKVKLNIVNNKLFIIWIAFFIINAIVALQLKVITIIPDELNPLGIPAYLSGLDWSTSISNYKNYYGYGQSIFYTPLFYLIKDNIILYKAIILLNSFLVSFIPVIAYKILNEFFSLKSDKLNLIIACAVGAQPCYLTLSKRAWNETLVMLLLWIVCYLFLKCLITFDNRKSNSKISVMLAIMLMYGYVTHGRFIAIIASVILTTIVHYIITRKKVISTLPFITSSIIMLLLNKVIKNFFLKKVWLIENEGDLRNTFAETLKRVFENIFSTDTLYVYLRALSGYIFYIFVASLGMIVLGWVLYSKILKNYLKKESYYPNKENETTIFFGQFCTISIICALGVAIIFFTTELLYSKNYYYFIYGRYTEYLVGPMLLLTFFIISKYGLTVKDLVITSLIYILHCIYTFLIEAVYITNKDITVGAIDIFTLESFSFGYAVQRSKFAFLAAILVAIVCFIIIEFLLYKKKYIFAYSFIICAFITSYVNTSTRLLISDSNAAYQSLETSYDFFCNIKLDNCFKKIYLYNIFPHSYQLALKNFNFEPIYDDQYKLDENTFVIMNGVYKLGCDYRYLYEVELDNNLNNERILVYGDELANKLSKQGVKLKSNTYSLGDNIQFSKSNSIENYKKTGWSIQEDWGMWSEGNKSELNFVFNKLPQKDLVVNLEINAFNGEKRLELYANEKYLTTLNVSENLSSYKVIIPQSFICNYESLDLMFVITDDLVSPKELGMSEDMRKLGFGIYSIQIN